MLTKKGELAEAEKIYNLAKLSDNYEDWPFKEVLENRILDIPQNALAFNQPLDEINLKSQSVILFNSKHSCVSCHQMGKNDLLKYNEFKGLGKEYYFPKKGKFQ
jgi:hypothetical protein